MPGALVQRHELDNLAITANQKMRGNREVLDLPVIRMFVRVKTVAEKLLDTPTAELSRREADGMDNQGIYQRPFRTRVTIGRCHVFHPRDNTTRRINAHGAAGFASRTGRNHGEIVADNPRMVPVTGVEPMTY